MLALHLMYSIRIRCPTQNSRNVHMGSCLHYSYSLTGKRRLQEAIIRRRRRSKNVKHSAARTENFKNATLPCCVNNCRCLVIGSPLKCFPIYR